MKKLIAILIFTFFAILLALWSPWLKWNISLVEILGVEKAEVISGMQVFSLSGEIEVFIDGESVGKISAENSPLIVDNIIPGEKLVRIERKSETSNAYTTFNELIYFEKNSDVVISINLGPTQEFSEWHIIYPKLKEETIEQTQLNVQVNTKDAEVTLDGVELQLNKDGTSTYPINLDKQLDLHIYEDGYDEQEIVLLPDTQDERNKLKSFNINVDVHLMLQPLIVE